MKKILISLLILSLIIFSQFNLSAQKTNDNSKGTGVVLKMEQPNFSINFPTNFKLEESSKDKGLKTELYRAVSGDDVYMLKYTEHKNPAVSADNDTYMQASIESFVTGIKGTLIKKDTFKYKKTKGTEAFLSLDGKNMNVFYRVLIINKVQYQLIVITKAEAKTSAIKNFFASFVCGVE